MRIEDCKAQKSGQIWPSCDTEVRDFVLGISAAVSDSLAGNLKGTVLLGSLATGAFHPPKSDVDLLVVSERALSDQQRWELWNGLLRLSDDRPLLGDIELSVIRKDVALAPCHPMPYELHFGDNLKDAIRTGKIRHEAMAVDEDLAAHAMMARRRGVSLVGAAPEALLGEVTWGDYVAAIYADFDWIVDGENIVETPFYGVLNICRVLWVATAGAGCIPDKEEGALWGIENLPAENRALIERALKVYRSTDAVPEQTAEARRQGGLSWRKADLLAFRDFAQARYRSLRS